ncbi:LmeA family phospholipid-binding protein [Roseofilum casamattae]|uniref:DUF2993 domain-containing protein n=1 Tax=Roseofilum casamattae BLCC-M143 TaxID=3022442 RepID=A0ABT7C074_9CYAN|nr:DUF2993 domain-containing protein [Roseofilum casamattae]MDJ1184144.1 DUF2993 domain-containing protein [Roseofilum casamattae BLCC-M143]
MKPNAVPDRPDNLTAPSAPKSRIISRVLSPALQLWLRSQAEQIEDLQLDIAAGDRQILSGLIPHVTVKAKKAIYQGLHLSQINLEADTIHTNLPQILRRKPLRLLSPIQAKGQIRITARELADSLFPESLLWQGLTDFLRELIKATGADPEPLLSGSTLQWQAIALDRDGVTITGMLSNADNPGTALSIDTGVEAIAGGCLRLAPLTIQASETLGLSDLESFDVDLGNETTISTLEITPEGLFCVGAIAILP